MKKVLLLAASACLFAVSANAQVRFGPEVGITSNSFNYDIDDIDESSNTGWRVGAAVDICLASHLTLQPGLYWSRKGGERDFIRSTAVVTPFNNNVVIVNGAEVEEKVDLSYLEIPLLLNYYFDAGPGRIFVGAGPTLSIGINGDYGRKIHTPGNGVVAEDEFDIDFGNDGHIKGTDFGIMANLGYDFDFGLFVRPFANWGLSDLSNNDNFTIHNRTWGIGLGYWFGNHHNK
ncbi:porin family protein [Polluticoccus soli]|uniref:porin family protein n=1 Tax=Polluticoccus soli TaxID=3034150 RepID=UPI0023E10C7A|nr:porin family protein [Flavipsychrobacter sp. JY13-12]